MCYLLLPQAPSGGGLASQYDWVGSFWVSILLTLRPLRPLATLYRSAWALPVLVAVLGLIGVLNHSMWRDEMNVWLIARDSASWGELIENIHYDRAHPGLWHLLVVGLYHSFGNPVAMQIFHWLLGVGSVVLIWVFSPFRRWQKWLLCFGYLPFYEHMLIARNYAVGMLALFAICTLWPWRRRSYLPLALLITLLANSNVYGLLIAIALGLTLGIELITDVTMPRRWLDIGTSAIIILIGCGISLYFILPPSDVADQALGTYVTGFDLKQLLKTLGRLFAGYYTIIPDGSRYVDLILCAAIALGSAGLVVLRLVRQPYALSFYLLANGLILAFTYAKFMPSAVRHFGNLYLVLLAALWIAHHYPPRTKLSPLGRWGLRSRRWYGHMLATILVFHLGAGLYFFTTDLRVPYSAGRAAAAYMRQTGLENEFIVASRDAQMASLSGYLGRPFYYPERQATGSYTLFFKGRRQEVEQSEVLTQARELLLQQDKILLVLSDELAADTLGLAVEPIRDFQESWQDEQYYLYWLSQAS